MPSNRITGTIGALVVVNRAKLEFVRDPARIDGRPETRIVSMLPPETAERIRHEGDAIRHMREIARIEAGAVRDTGGDGGDDDRGGEGAMRSS